MTIKALNLVSGSSLIEADAWDRDQSRLLIKFKSNHTIYSYQISPSMWQAYSAAESKGQYFTKHIKPVIQGNQVHATVAQ